MDSSDSDSEEVSTANFQGNASESQRQPSGMKRRLTSDVWHHFTIIGKDIDDKERGICNYCKKEYIIGTSSHGTSTLRRHLLVCKKKPEFCNTDEMSVDHEGGIDYGYVRHLITMIILKHDLPFAFVEYEHLRDFFHYLNPDFEFISAATAIAGVCEVYKAQKEKLKLALARIPSRVCLTCDIWTACTTETYICLVTHFVDEDWNLNTKVLSFCPIFDPHSTSELTEKILGCLKDWGIEKKIFSLTLDNASTNDKIQNILEEQLRLHDSLLGDGEYFHLRCCANILDRIVQEGLKVVGDVLHKIRESLKYLKGSEERTKLFQEYVQQSGVQNKVAFCLDVQDQWDSVYMMLHGAITYRSAFSSIQSIDENYRHCPSDAEWSKGEKICKFLEPLSHMTNLISGSSYPTSNLYFMEVWKIGCLLKESMEKEDGVIKEMASRMHAKFVEYWDKHSVVLAMGAAFDPRMKFEMLEFCYSKLDPCTCKEKLDNVKRNLNLLFEQYKNISTTASFSSASSNQNGISLPILSKQEGDKKGGSSLLDIYFEEEARLPMTHYEDMDVLHYWRDYREKYGVLACMACDLLSVPITTAASESFFSVGGRAFKKDRSCVLHPHIQAKLCARNWLLGFVIPDNDDKDDEVVLFPPAIPEPDVDAFETDSE